MEYCTHSSINGVPLHVKTDKSEMHNGECKKASCVRKQTLLLHLYEAQKHVKPDNIMFRDTKVHDYTI